MFQSKTKTALKDFFESLGDQAGLETFRGMLKENKIGFDDLSIREVHESVTSDLFPQITGELIHSKVIEGYKSQTAIGDELVTVVNSKNEQEVIAGFTAGQQSDRVLEGTSYNDSTIGEKYVQALPAEKYGRVISITEEMIYFDKTLSVIQASQNIGVQAGRLREKRIVQSVLDVGEWASNIYRPSGVGEPLYDAVKENLITTATFGEESLEKVMKVMDSMTDEEGEYINVQAEPLVGLFPVDLWRPANEMVQSTLIPEALTNAVNQFKGWYKPLRSPWVTADSTSTWYIGAPKKQFWLLNVWPLETFSQGKQSEDGFMKDISYKFKVRQYFMVVAVDYRWFFKCTA